MKCPLLLIAQSRVIEARADRWTDCLKKECAWWDDIMKRCEVTTIAVQLELIKTRLNLIEALMPHKEQVGK